MSVNNLETPERGMNLSTREPKGAKEAEDAIDRVKRGAPTAAAELVALRARVEAARTLKPEGVIHCSDCAQAFANGRDAAIKAIEG